MSEILNNLTAVDGSYINVFVTSMRYLAPMLVAILLWRCGKPLLTFRREPEIWAWLCLADGRKVPVTHWENVIGRHKRCDIVMDFPTVSRNHAVLTRYDDGSWTIADINSKSGVRVNGRRAPISVLTELDVISIGGIEMTLQPISRHQEAQIAKLRTRGSSGIESITNLLVLSIFQVLSCMAFLFGSSGEYALPILLGYGGILVAQWALLVFYLTLEI